MTLPPPSEKSRERRTIAMGAAVISVLLLFSVAIPRLRWAVTIWSARIEAERRELVALSRLLESEDSLVEEGARARAFRRGAESGLLKARSPQEGAASLATVIGREAERALVRFSSTAATADSAFTGEFARVSVRAIGTADFAGLVSLLQALERNASGIAIRGLRVSQPQPFADDGTPESLRVELVAEALVVARDDRR